MRKILALVPVLAFCFALSGCGEKTTTTEVKTNPITGSQTTKDTTVTEHPNGDVTKETTKTKTNDSGTEVKVEKKVETVK